MLIREVLHDERFTGVVYYFESNGFSSISDLETFDFELLYFVPGLNDEVITEATELCQKACLPQENTDDVENHEIVTVCDDENIGVDISEEDCEEEKADQLLEVFADLVDKLSAIEGHRAVIPERLYPMKHATFGGALCLPSVSYPLPSAS